jgi:lysozyme family protein
MTVIKVAEATSQAKKICLYKNRYQAVEAQTGVPWFVIGCLHMRESNGNFNTWLHNGDPMVRNGQRVKTVHVPVGRPPNPDVSWETGAYDALVTCERLNEITDWCPERVAYACEQFNGFGYRNPSRNIPSPYLWGGTSVQKPGKFVSDGVYDATVMDPQVGAMAVLKQVMAVDPDAKFKPVASVTDDQPAVDLESIPDPVSPSAEDTVSEVKPVTRSKTMWGGIMGYVSSLIGIISGFFDKLTNPYTLAAFVLLLAVVTVAAYLVIKGRIDVQKLVQHLSEDDQ